MVGRVARASAWLLSGLRDPSGKLAAYFGQDGYRGGVQEAYPHANIPASLPFTLQA